MSAFLFFGIAILMVLAIVIVYFAKSMKGSGGTILGIRQQPLIMDFDGKVIGRLAGEPIFKSDAVDIPYKTGMFGSKWLRDVPEFAILHYEPPTTPHKEGIYVILPHTYGKLTGFKLWDDIISYNNFFEMKASILQGDLNELKELVEDSVDSDKYMKKLRTIHDHFNVLKSGMASRGDALHHELALEKKPEPRVVVQTKRGAKT